jgi:glycosyltransferase involved in cell wall biosynthesis
MFNSAPERELAVRLYGLRRDGSAVVGMGVEVDVPDHGAFGAARGLTEPYVIYCGRREPLKGTPLLVDYLRTFRERTRRGVGLVLTGSGPVEIPAEMRGSVVDVGFVPEREKWEAMAGAAAFCHPSTLESLGIVVLEAWLCGTPALVHDGSEVLRYHCRRSGGGLWFRNYPEFEEELSALLDNPDLGRRLGKCGQEYVRREYSWDRVENRLLDALDR